MLFHISIYNPGQVSLTYAGSQVYKFDMTFYVKDANEAEDLIDHFLSELSSDNAMITELIDDCNDHASKPNHKDECQDLTLEWKTYA